MNYQDDYSRPEEGQGPVSPYGTLPGQVRPAAVSERQASKPIVTYTIMGITVFIFILQFISPYVWGFRDLPAALGMKVNELIRQGELWRLFTPALLHGDLLHIGFNMYALYIFGPGLERHYGHWRFLALYVLGAFTGNVVSFLFSSAPSLGSSTAIFGLLAAEGIFLYLNRKLLGESARRALNNIILIAVINLFIGLSGQIDNWGHVGGLVGGALFAWFAGPLYYLEDNYPYRTVRDRRGTTQAVLTFLGVGLVFALLAAIGFR